MKRTYNLPQATVRTVRDLAEEYMSTSQDRVVEIAIEELAQRVRDEQEREAWTRAASDPLFDAEMDRLDREFASADAETWPPR